MRYEGTIRISLNMNGTNEQETIDRLIDTWVKAFSNGDEMEIEDMEMVGDATNELLSIVDEALDKYDSDNVEVNLNDEDGNLYVIYTSRNNSFRISECGYDPDYVDMNVLTEELNNRNVGQCY